MRHRFSSISLLTTSVCSRVETDSEKYSWLNRVDFVAPGNFNGTEVMTVNHYFPNVSFFFPCHARLRFSSEEHGELTGRQGHNLPNGLPPNHSAC